MQSNEINEILPTSKALHISLDDNPNLAVYKKMEKIIERMQKVRSPAFSCLTFPMVKIFLTSSGIHKCQFSYWLLVFHQSKRIETEIEKVQLLTFCNLLKIQEGMKEEFGVKLSQLLRKREREDKPKES